MTSIIFRRSYSNKRSQSAISVTVPSSKAATTTLSPRSPEQIWDEGVQRVRERQRSRQSSCHSSRNNSRHELLLEPPPATPDKNKGRYSDATILDVISRYQNENNRSPAAAGQSPLVKPKSVRFPSKTDTCFPSDGKVKERADSLVQSVERTQSTQSTQSNRSTKKTSSLSSTPSLKRGDAPVPRQHGARFRKSADVITQRPRNIMISSRPITISANIADHRYLPAKDASFRTPIFSEEWSHGFPQARSRTSRASRASNANSYKDNFVINPTPPTSSRNSINTSCDENSSKVKGIQRKPVPSSNGSRRGNASPHYGAHREYTSSEHNPPGSSCGSQHTWTTSSSPPFPSTPTSEKYNSTILLQENLKSAFDDDDSDNDTEGGFMGRLSLRSKKVFSRKSSVDAAQSRHSSIVSSDTKGSKGRKPERRRNDINIKSWCGCLRAGNRQ